MRSEVLKVSSAVYVEAARASGVRTTGVLFRHVLPNAAGPVLSLSALEFGVAVLAVSALSFLGFGAPPPAPEWGSLVAGGRGLPRDLVVADDVAGSRGGGGRALRQPDRPGTGEGNGVCDALLSVRDLRISYGSERVGPWGVVRRPPR